MTGEKKIKSTKKKPNKKTNVKKDLNSGIELSSLIPLIAISGIFVYLFF